MFTFSESHSVRSGSRLSANKTPLYSENKPSCGQCQLSTLVHQVVDTLSHCALQKSALLLFQAMISLLCFLPLLWYQSSSISVFPLSFSPTSSPMVQTLLWYRFILHIIAWQQMLLCSCERPGLLHEIKQWYPVTVVLEIQA